MKELREAVREYAVVVARPIYFKKNDRDKVTIRCKGMCTGVDCPFLMYAYVVKKGPTVRIKNLQPNHLCGREDVIKFATSSWLADRYEYEMRTNPKMTPADFITMVADNYGIIITKDQYYKAKQKSTERIHGGIEEQYGLLWNYAEELKRVNPGSTIKILPQLRGEEPIFRRMYVCYAALRDGFLDGCRRLVGFDGCHIKGPHKKHGPDKQKGLGNAIKAMMPCAEHRHCVRHLYNNFKNAGHNGLALKNSLWSAARATTVPWYEEEMDNMFKFSPTTENWFIDKPPKNWSRSHFITDPKCDILLNNLCEAVNAAILDTRDKPILSNLEKLRTYLMLRMAKQRETKWTQPVGPRIFGIIEAKRKEGGQCTTRHSGNGEFEVKRIQGKRQFHVNLNHHTCSCRKWQLCGLPCAHAMAAISKMQRSVYDYVHVLYKRPAYDRAYQSYISPMSSPKLWPKTQHRPLKPPACVKQPGRPKKKRIKEVGEVRKGATKLPRYDTDIHCGRCGAEGHNSRSCSQGLVRGKGTSRGRGLSRGRGMSRGRGRGRMSSGSGLEPPARQTTIDNESGRGRAVIRGMGRVSTRARGRGPQVQAKQPVTATTYESVNRGGHVVQLSRQLEGTTSTQSSQANQSSFNDVRSQNAAQRARPWKL
ncbi:hypothetical protein M0R45_024802 [Rubus argutus]|uniref:SWIM-type domain-containing protein n=1 Tax=Rubus argutus TaxID=59490 RepID=A0AAW1WVB0_RUBAR